MKTMKSNFKSVPLAIVVTTLLCGSWLAAQAQTVTNKDLLQESPKAQVQAESRSQKDIQGAVQARKVKLYFKTSPARTGGIVTSAAKADNPLQLINPFAPASYGTGGANVIVDAEGKRPAGLALLVMRY